MQQIKSEENQPTQTREESQNHLPPLSTAVHFIVYIIWLCQEKESNQIIQDNVGNTFSELG